MYHPTTRLLTVLELLQTYATLSGAELARRLEVEPRSVRRYIGMLQDMGMPIEATRGPGGGYRLRPGFKLPPLIFSEEEATALVLGLLGTARLELGQPAMAVEGALAKVLRVLPLRARERLHAVTTNLIVAPYDQAVRPDAALLLDLSEAIQERRRIAIDYRSQRDELSHRAVEPYTVAGWWGRWYLVGYCCLRHDVRMFRLDRMSNVAVLPESFTRPADFDGAAYVQAQLSRAAARWQVVVEFMAPARMVQQGIPERYGTWTDTPDGVRCSFQHGDLDAVAGYLALAGVPFVVHEPPELRDRLRALAERLAAAATAPGASNADARSA
jgi:predicted DNA-binding transcriptional regulator YafY